ncbi:fructose-specific PTS transporter subunit EIIC [Scandinavium sp. H11S7]|uniref:PTS fructose transporter subunit IIC n=1 Tax=Scandinavium hiltneri TaxID=2926519 RepID=UPI0021655EAD|nr:fructose-specific PTS transporter subunit EIIC [Scandinavium hiltneri]MCS2157289.1 fructose-specific PTS transporter subunit EIIC [Scandinavium hiltneri]
MTIKRIVAVTACPTGIAHTFMAARKIEEWAKAAGYEVKVETQGSDGVKHMLTPADIAAADAVILSVDVPVQDPERFEGVPHLDVRTQELIKHTDLHMQKAIGLGKRPHQIDAAEEMQRSAYQVAIGHIMTGISYMLPVVVLGGLLMAVAKITGQFIDIKGSPFAVLDQLGFMTMKFMYPVFAMYLAFSIAGKPALIPGFIGGVMTDEVYKRFFSLDGFMPSGFFGAIAVGFFVGYLVRWLNDTIRIRAQWTTLKTMLVVPLITGIILVLVMQYLINPFFGSLNQWMVSCLTAAGDTGRGFYSTMIAAGTAFDLGGPINKAAGSVALGLNGMGQTFDLTARELSIVIPSIGVGLAALLSGRFGLPDPLSGEDKMLGSTSLLLGLLGISEGAIPFILKNPKLIPVFMSGAIAGTLVAVSLGVRQSLPLPAIWGWPLATNVPGYLLGILSGSLVCAAGVLLLSKATRPA